MYLAFFSLVHLWEYCKQAAGLLWHLSSFSARQDAHRQTVGQSALRFILLCLPVLELFQFIKSVGENIAMSALVSVTATSVQEEHLCVIWRVAGRRCETANVSHYTHNNWPKTPTRSLPPYAVAPFLRLFISFPLLLSDSSEAGLDLQPRQP